MAKPPTRAPTTPRQAEPPADPACTNAFVGSTRAPTDAELAAALGPAKPRWDALRRTRADVHDVRDEQWRTYSRKSGWALRLMRGDRAVAYLSPCTGAFFVSVVLGDAAMEAARACTFPATVTEALASARRYVEGTGVRFAVTGEAELEAAVRLAEVKLSTGRRRAPRSARRARG